MTGIELSNLKADFRALHQKYGTSEASFSYEELKTLTEDQKKRLKEKKESAETKLAEAEEKLGKKIIDLENRIFGGHKKRLIAKASEDEETRTKISDKVDTLMKTDDYPNDEEGIGKAVSDAILVVTGAKPKPGFLDGATSAGDRGDEQKPGDGKTESEESKLQRKALNISDKDREEFGEKE